MEAPRKITIPQLWLASGIVTTLILACTPKAAPHSVEFYLDSKEARLARLKECDNNVGTLKDDADCINARQASIRVWSKPNLKPFDPSSSTGQQSGTASNAASDATK